MRSFRYVLAILLIAVSVINSPASVAPVSAAPVSAVPMVVSYSSLPCSYGYHTHFYNAWAMQDMYGSSTDYGLCFPKSMFLKRHGYEPVWGFETNVAETYGKVVVDPLGECNVINDTGPYWDFRVPCQGHDYCYDLVRVGMGTITKSPCDDSFHDLMYAHCIERSVATRALCLGFHDVVYASVVAGGSVSSSPPTITAQALHSGQCIDVFNGSGSIGASIQQFPCTGGANQSWKLHPVSSFPGWYFMTAQHSGLCAGEAGGWVVQEVCTSAFGGSMIKVQGAFGQDNYTLRFYTNGECVDVPYSSMSAINLLDWPCYETSNQRWDLG